MTASAASAVDVKALYSQALALVREGRGEAALPVLGRIIEANPRVAEAHWMAAQIFCDADNFPRALGHAEAAVRLRPAEPAVWITWADTVALSGVKEAERAFLAALREAGLPMPVKLRLQDRFGSQRAAARLDVPGVPAAQVQGAMRLMAARDFAKAEAQAAALVRAQPKSALAANLLGSALAGQGKTAAAMAQLQAAAKLDPFYPEPHLNAARVLVATGKPDEAARALRSAIARAPDLEAALLEYGTILNQQMKAQRAKPWLERALRLQPKSVAGLIAMGNCCTQLREHEEAADHLRRAVDLSARKSPEALCLLSQSLSHLGRDDEALALVDEALALRPDFLLAIVRKATLLQLLGRFDEAEGYFRTAMERAPQDGELFRNYMASHKAGPDDPLVDQMMARIEEPALDDRARMGFAFAIAKGLEDQKRHDAAFAYIRQGNDLMRKLYPYDIEERRAEVALLKRVMAGFDWAGTQVPEPSAAAPIFVTGMPRSGTTLVEQIISSHSSVTGAGELGLFLKSARDAGFAARDQRLADMPPEAIARIGHDFARQLAERFPDAARITDKSITTYNYIGLVRLALPQARIVVVRRDPRDTLLSIYKNRFPEGTHPYAYDLRDLANYYATFVEMVEFWRAETPDWFTEVQYETLVANPEAESRRLVAACGLDWEDACLNFHENKRRVDTLSVYQVRQPISGGSVKAWQRYEAELAPMIEVLAERGLLPE
ncbi:sulfotransferase [Rhodobacteraceae bacterium HSP-20]|uniref:Sulfotransferase n=1 Tax=Paragemmobacter amnigenus TaxID=2852097 RepID=A0ABS6J2J3_9RHOB|nr:tetratricopeptide repeat-containing sulfotransferase family protein [Rhodobacter amnigenus]MBU9697747.1 sulfotransferase [Rhodobacter amnigenus]MBV4388974.1 sulfotransferase [Rhodobacter amnigenus]